MESQRQQLLHQMADLGEAIENAEDIQVTDAPMERMRAGNEHTYSHEEVWARIEAPEVVKGAATGTD